jgi:hypothetical protein
MDNINRLKLTVSAALLPYFSQLLEQGFILKAPLGCSIRDLICGQLGLESQYLEEKIQTIFLDHKPVDDPDSAILHEGAVMALSAAMPGLAGATLRKGGRFAALRKRISCDTAAERRSEQKTKVTIKYFNMVAKELGRKHFDKGVWIKGSNLNWFFSKHIENLKARIKSVQLDDQEIDTNRLSEIIWQEEVFLRICIDQSG